MRCSVATRVSVDNEGTTACVTTTGLASSQSSSRKATLNPSRKATQTRTVRETKHRRPKTRVDDCLDVAVLYSNAAACPCAGQLGDFQQKSKTRCMHVASWRDQRTLSELEAEHTSTQRTGSKAQ